MYSFGAMLSFTTAHVAVLALRIKEPGRERPYRAPLNFRVRGVELSLTPILGALGPIYAWLSVVALHVEARTVGIGWMVAGLAGYAIYRRRSGLDLTSRARIERGERPPDFTELAYRSALVPIFGTDVDADALSAAARLVDGEATVDALYVVQVPPQLSLDAGLEAEEARVLVVLEAARLAGVVAALRSPVEASEPKDRTGSAGSAPTAKRARLSALLHKRLMQFIRLLASWAAKPAHAVHPPWRRSRSRTWSRPRAWARSSTSRASRWRSTTPSTSRSSSRASSAG